MRVRSNETERPAATGKDLGGCSVDSTWAAGGAVAEFRRHQIRRIRYDAQVAVVPERGG